MRVMKVCLLVALWLMLSWFVFVSANPGIIVHPTLQEDVTIYFIDVGQGDSIFIDTSGFDVLIDGGTRTAGATVVEFLQGLSIIEVHLMVATHMDSDHIGGLIDVLNSDIQVNQVLINNQTSTTVTYNDFIALANLHPVFVAQRGDLYTLTQNVNLTILNPIQPLEFNEQNQNSVAMRLQIGESSILLMGDSEIETEESILQSGLTVNGDVLKVGHHGSNTATSDYFLNAVSPSIAIISAGADNPYGHPHQETLDKLFASQITVYSTYKSGTIALSANSTSIQVLDDPTPIPELSMPVMMTSLTVTLYVALTLRKRTPYE